MGNLSVLVALAVTAGSVFLLSRFLSMGQILEALDLSNNMDRCVEEVKTISPSHLWAYGLVYAILGLFVAFPLAWHFDLDSSWDAMEQLRTVIEASQSTNPLLLTLGISFTFVAVALTYASTLFEMFGGRLARGGVVVFQAMVWAFVGFDLFTDLPRAKAFVETTKPFFDNGGVLGNIGYYLWFTVWWLLSTYGFELALVLLIWSAYLCFYRLWLGHQGKPRVVGNR